MRSVSLTRAASPDAATLTVTAVAAVDMPTAVFRVTPAGVFAGVCTPHELTTLPLSGGTSFNRADRLSSVFSSAGPAAEFWVDLQRAVNELVGDLNGADRLAGVETVNLRGT